MSKNQTERITYLFNCIKEEADVSTFVLNKKVAKYLKEIEEIQEKCNHIFQDGSCIYCLKKEKIE